MGTRDIQSSYAFLWCGRFVVLPCFLLFCRGVFFAVHRDLRAGHPGRFVVDYALLNPLAPRLTLQAIVGMEYM